MNCPLSGILISPCRNVSPGFLLAATTPTASWLARRSCLCTSDGWLYSALKSALLYYTCDFAAFVLTFSPFLAPP